MYREGTEYITYTPVAAYGVSTYAEGIVSGGTGENVTETKGTRFLWVYDPDNLDTSGFIGEGWFCEVPNTPLANITEAELIRQFNEDNRIDLNDFFQKWQTVVENGVINGEDYVSEFAFMIGTPACVKMSY